MKGSTKPMRQSIVIGNFDGVHKGHQALIRAARAAAPDLPLAALTFSPHPRRFFAPDSPPFLLCDESGKTRLLKAAGVDNVITLPFDATLAAMPHADFTRLIVRDLAQAAHVCVGADFAYGHGRHGTIDTLRAAGDQLGFTVQAIDKQGDGTGQIYSSSAMRIHIAQAQFAEASALAGYDWFIGGTVQHGDKRGRTLGYPTANMAMGDYIRPPYGIYAVTVRIAGDNAVYGGVANLGIRPMFETPAPLLETFIFDFDSDIYGKRIEVTPIQFLRPEMKFDGIESLKNQMHEDCALARGVVKSAIRTD